MADDVARRVVRIIAEQTLVDPADITDDTPVAELGLDSLALVDVVFAIEEAFGIKVPFNANEAAGSVFDISTVGQVVADVRTLIAANG